MSGLSIFLAGGCAIFTIIDIKKGQWRWHEAPLGIFLTVGNLLAGALL